MAEDEPIAEAPTAETEATVNCWRCGLEVLAVAPVCPHCAARSRVTGQATQPAAELQAPIATIQLLLWSFAILLITGILHAFALEARFRDVKVIDAATRENALWQMLIVEAIDTVVIVAAICRWQRPATSARPAPRMRIFGWLALLPVVAGLLALNLGYHWVLRTTLGLPLLAEELVDQFTWLTLLVTCVQPAIAEEAYCRWFALDSLQEVTSRRASVWISATMFALMHVAVLPSIPYFILFGVVLARFRLATGSLLLPILIHFLHNLLILLWW